MFTGLKHLHLLMVILFLLSMVIKTILLFVNKDKFAAYKQKTKIPEMITTIVFLITGVVMGALGIALCGVAGRNKEKDIATAVDLLG